MHHAWHADRVSTADHWDQVYSSKHDDQTSWFTPEFEPSLSLIISAAAPPARILDVGAGRSQLASRLTRQGYRVSALDVSSTALAQLRSACPQVRTIHADVTRWTPTDQYQVIHDRAVFHFLASSEAIHAYIDVMGAAAAPGSWLIVGTFAPDGPDTCSGLPVQRYDADQLAELFQDGWSAERSSSHEHRTPWGASQPFTWLVLRRTSAPESSLRT